MPHSRLKRIGILTAGGDTPALNATIHGADGTILGAARDAVKENKAMEYTRQKLFSAGNLTQPYHSINTDVNKSIRYLLPPAA